MVVAFIPARGGSKTILKKNLKLLGGKPLIAYSIDTGLKCGLRTIVNTDDSEIAQVAKEYGAEVMMRPSNLAKDDTSMFDVLRSEIPKIEPNPDLVLLLQPTFFPRKTVLIKTAISYMSENIDKYNSLIVVEKIPEKYHPALAIISNSNDKRMVMGKLLTLKDKIKSYFTGIKYTKPSLVGYPISQRITRRQDHPEAWVPTGELYIFRPENLLKGSFYGENVLLLETSGDGTNINTLEDFQKAQELYESKQN